MFGNLIESGSHRRDFKRKGKFFLGTLVFYSALLVAAGIGSIYAYNVRLDDQNELELMTMLRFPPAPTRAEPERREVPRAASSANRSQQQQYAVRPEISIQTPYKTDRVASLDTKEVGARTPVIVGPGTSDPEFFSGPVGPPQNGSPNGRPTNGGVVIDSGDGEGPPPIKRTPVPPPVEKKTPPVVSLGVINGRAIDKPVPVYSTIAKAARAAGTVTVQILVDENGRVISAQATNGHPLLLKACVDAAYRARFTPTLLSNHPVKVSGFITYNFVLN